MTYAKTLWYLTLCSPLNYVLNSCKAVHLANNIKQVNFSTSNFTPKEDGPPWRIMFFGTDSFSLSSLQLICAKLRTQTLISDLSVVSRAGSITRKFAETEKLKYYDWPLDDNIIRGHYDFGIVVSFGHLIPERIITAFPFGLVNIHGSLLPRWRGAAPIVYAIKEGDPEIGVTIMTIKPKKFDTGDIVKQYRCPIGPNETAKNLTDKLAKEGALLLMECIRDLPRCLEMAIPQPQEGITLAPKVNASLAVLNWETMDSKAIYNLYRAVSHLYPLSCYWHGAQLRLFDIQPFKAAESESVEPKQSQSSSKSAIDFLNSGSVDKTSSHNVNKDVQPGRIRYNPKTQILRIQCMDGKYVQCSGLAFVGKKQLSMKDFFNGYLSKRKENEWVLSSKK